MFDAGLTDIDKFDDALINDLAISQIRPNVLSIFIDRILPNPVNFL